MGGSTPSVLFLGFAFGNGFFLLAVCELVFGFVKIQHGVELRQPCGFLLQLIFLGKRLLDLFLCLRELAFGVRELFPAGVLLVRQRIEHVIDSGEVAVQIRAERDGVMQRMVQRQLVLARHGIEVKLHGKTAV